MLIFTSKYYVNKTKTFDKGAGRSKGLPSPVPKFIYKFWIKPVIKHINTHPCIYNCIHVATYTYTYINILADTNLLSYHLQIKVSYAYTQINKLTFGITFYLIRFCTH